MCLPFLVPDLRPRCFIKRRAPFHMLRMGEDGVMQLQALHVLTSISRGLCLGLGFKEAHVDGCCSSVSTPGNTGITERHSVFVV